MAVDIGAAFKITASVAGQQAVDNLNKSVSNLQGFAKSAGMALAGLSAGVGLSVLKTKFDDVVSAAAGLKDVAERTGSTVENMGALSRAANLTNNDFGDVEKAIIKMNKALAGSDDTAKGAAHALSAIGLNISQLRTLDPAEAFKRISTAMAGFEDGAGKVAVAMDIFGKNGAQVIPFMNDLVEVGDLVSKTTREQAELADDYEKNLKRLTATKGELYKVISMELLPVANAFVKALIDTNNETNGVRAAAKDLANDGTLTTIFKEAARAAAAFLDILSLVVKGIAQIGSSIGVVMKDITTVAELAMKAPGALFKHGGVEELKAIMDERSKYVAGANQSMADRWSNLTPYTDALEKQFSNMGKGEAQAPRSKALSGYQSRDPSAGTKSDPYASELSSLGREAAKMQWMTEHIDQYAEKISSAREAQARFDTEAKNGKFVGESQARKDALVKEAKAVDDWSEKLRQAKEGLAYDKATKNVEAETRALTMNAEQKQITLAMQDLENRGIKEGSDLWEKLSARRIEAIKAQTAEQSSWLTGLRQGLNEYSDHVANFGASMKNAVTSAFKGMEDALVNFVMTGKLNFKSLATSIIQDLIRIQIQQMITKPLAGMLGGMFGGGGGAANVSGLGTGVTGFNASFAGGGYTGNGARSGGLDGMGGFAAILHPQETVVDHARGQGMGGSNSVVVNVNVDGGGQQVSSTNGAASLGKAIAAAVQAELLRQKRPGGLLTA